MEVTNACRLVAVLFLIGTLAACGTPRTDVSSVKSDATRADIEALLGSPIEEGREAGYDYAVYEYSLGSEDWQPLEGLGGLGSPCSHSAGGGEGFLVCLALVGAFLAVALPVDYALDPPEVYKSSLKVFYDNNDVAIWASVGSARKPPELARAMVLEGQDCARCDFSQLDLSSADMSGLNLSGAQFMGTRLIGANLSDANLQAADFTDADLTDADLTGADIGRAKFDNSLLVRTNLTATNFWNARLETGQFVDVRVDGWDTANFAERTFSGIDLSGANLAGTSFFAGADLSQTNLRTAKLNGVDFEGTNLRGANLSEASLMRANLANSDLSHAIMRNLDLSSVDLQGANLEGADLRAADLSSTNLTEANLTGANLSGADFRNAKLDHAVLSDTDVTHANFWLASLEGVDLSGLLWRDCQHCDFTARQFSGIDLSGMKLTGRSVPSRSFFFNANLSGADLRGVNLEFANLTGTDLSRADLRAAKFRRADLTSANLSGAVVDDLTDFTDVIFCNTTMPDGTVNNSRCPSTQDVAHGGAPEEAANETPGKGADGVEADEPTAADAGEAASSKSNVITRPESVSSADYGGIGCKSMGTRPECRLPGS